MNIKQFFLFFVSKTFWFNIIAIVIMSILLIIGTFFWLNKYTGHGEAEIVPDMRGLTVEESLATLQSKHLRYEVVDSIYQKGEEPGVIIEQLPLPSAKVKKNRIVFLTINAKSPLTLFVPDVRDMSQRQATAILKGSGFTIGEIEYIPSEYKNLVVDISHKGENIIGGQKLPIGSTINLVVGEGYSNEMIEVPSFNGLTLLEATNKAVESSLTIGGVFYDVEPANEEDKNNYVIYKQSPLIFSSVPRGKAIELYLTQDKSRIKEEETIHNANPIEIDNKDESWF